MKKLLKVLNLIWHYRCRGPVSVRSLLKTPHKPPDLGR